ncbi:hypothetical protein ABID20_004737 [Rhizobium alvei]
MPLSNSESFKEFHDRLRLHNPRHSFKMHTIDRPGQIIPVGQGLKIAVRYNCLVQKISSAGAMLDLSPRVQLPKNFFLVILGSSEEIGATEFQRKGATLVVKFNMFLDAGFLETLVGAASLEGDVV